MLLTLLVISASSCGVYLEGELYDEVDIVEYYPQENLQLTFTVSWEATQTDFTHDLEFDLITPTYQRISKFSDSARCYYDAFYSAFTFDDNSMVILCDPALLGDYDLEIRSNTGHGIDVYVQIDQSLDYSFPYPLEYASFEVRPYETLVYPIYITE